MTTNLFPAVTLGAALGCGVVAGLLFTFSAFLMTALGRLPTAQGITTMQTINVVILNPAFGLVFFGTMFLCLFLAATFPFTAYQPNAVWRLIGSVLFLAGVGLVTVFVNVPLNSALAEVDPSSLEGAKLWEHYRAAWTGWNHLRTLAAIGATLSFMFALQQCGDT